MITYVKGDATLPLGSGSRIIVHCCNDKGGWGSGFVLAVSKRWKEPEEAYRKWYRDGENFKLGEVQFVTVEKYNNGEIVVANMIGQHGYKGFKGKMGSSGPPIRYEAIKDCLHQVYKEAKEINATVHGPRFGAGLAGGDWNKIEAIINEIFTNIPVTIYDFE